MKIMKKTVYFISVILLLILTSFTQQPQENKYSLTVHIDELRNYKGVVQVLLYNKNNTIPDEHFEKYHQKKTVKITEGTTKVTFFDLPEGNYAITIHHDENENKKIDKGWFLPIEGVGFSNFKSINLANRPNFKKASFYLNSNQTKVIKTIYM